METVLTFQISDATDRDNLRMAPQCPEINKRIV
uniref:Uncharacterized protein n=1 Tax=Arundo donax TaxID=35708 RepID=A0A0A9BKQ5_ARUDO